MKPPLEKDIQMAICEYLAYKRYFFWRQNNTPIFNNGRYYSMPKFALAGVPDIILIKPPTGKFVGLEVKRPTMKKLFGAPITGVQSQGQKDFQKWCEESGGEYHLVTGIDDLVRIGL